MKTLLLASAVALAGATGAAQAATANLDFVALAAGNEGGVEGTTFSFGGLDVTVTSSHNAYLDDLSGGLPGGLGVCKVLTSSNQCTPSDDDNVTVGEWVKLSFSQAVTLQDFSFNDANHYSLNASSQTLYGEATGYSGSSYEFNLLASGVVSALTTGLTLHYGGNNPSQFYLSAVTANYANVPLPAAGLLLLGAFGGLAALRRRKG